MKNLLLLLSFLFLSLSTNAQDGKFIGPFKIKKVDLMIGIDSDRIDNFDGSYFTDQLATDPDFALREIDFKKPDLIDATCENPHVRFGLTLEIPNSPRLEWRNAINWMPNRIDAIYYSEYNIYEPSKSSNLFLTQDQSELALESSIHYSLFDVGFFKIYTGAGSNAGISYNNFITASGSNIDQIEGVTLRDNAVFDSPRDGNTYFSYYGSSPAQFNHRIFAQVGASIIICKRVELGIDLRRGFGYRASKDLPTQFTKLVSSGLSLRYILK